MAITEGEHCYPYVRLAVFGRERWNVQVLNPRRAPRIRNIFVSAVASSTAVGTLLTWIPRAVQAWMSI